MRYSLKILWIFLLVGCVDSNQEIPPLESQVSWVIEARQILRGELYEPEGKLKIRFTYDSEDESTLRGSKKYFYNSQGQNVLNLGFSATNDTMVAWLPRYNPNGELSELMTFRYPYGQNQQNLNGGNLARLHWSSTSYYSYDDKGRLVLRESSSPRYERRPRVALKYNERGLLEKEEYFLNHEAIGYMLYEYDEDWKLIKKSEFSTGGDTPHRVFFMRYDENGLLAAEQTGELYNPDLEQRDVFQYFYDSQGRLIEEREFYPNMGFPILNRMTYEYFVRLEEAEKLNLYEFPQ